MIPHHWRRAYVATVSGLAQRTGSGPAVLFAPQFWRGGASKQAAKLNNIYRMERAAGRVREYR
jgi:hypothetical protein